MGKCLFQHKWDGCLCKRCGQRRNQEHVFEYDIEFSKEHKNCTKRCKRCQSIKFIAHSFELIPGKCLEVCSFCGKENRLRHKYERLEGTCTSKCSVCGEIVQRIHNFSWNGCKEVCEECGLVRAEHKWNRVKYGNSRLDGCRCEVCGAANENGRHDWELIEENGFANIRECSVCGERDDSEKMTLEEWERKKAIDAKIHEMYVNMDEGIFN